MLNKKMMKELHAYIKRNFIVMPANIYDADNISFDIYSEHNELENYIKTNKKDSISSVLFKIIDKKGLTDVEVYKRAGLDRKHFSKIRSNANYKISKQTAVSLAIALRLTKKETEQLMNVAGFSLSENDTFDLIIQFCLEKQIYDIDDINQALHSYDLKPLIRA
ncbi:hypothetical protein NC661_16265 [Aquibacillus koreensis]|uniref:XRE family transcriptional regulator n=1 Tax=Aquibacillus koreensis TaxID=279446 RepID=A0A9X4AJD4_9BACI|nr:hypothetical protein [Aquibacillus koreensis]MCT2536938.1 hypothetical protein [Aquibacillus koreensis]MDC3421931.1 hypothetical protein [Aquibacillus koreensis]